MNDARQEIEDMLNDVANTEGDYKAGYQQAILNVLSILDYHILLEHKIIKTC